MGIWGIAVAAAWSVVLALIDVAFHRLPNTLTVPAAAAALVACAMRPPWAWGLAWPGAYLCLGRGIGGGDIKLAVPLGVAVCAMAGPLGVIGAVGLSGLLTGLSAAVMGRRRVAHGPAMLASTWIVAAVFHLAA